MATDFFFVSDVNAGSVVIHLRLHFDVAEGKIFEVSWPVVIVVAISENVPDRAWIAWE